MRGSLRFAQRADRRSAFPCRLDGWAEWRYVVRGPAGRGAGPHRANWPALPGSASSTGIGDTRFPGRYHTPYRVEPRGRMAPGFRVVADVVSRRTEPSCYFGTLQLRKAPKFAKLSVRSSAGMPVAMLNWP